MSNAEKPHHEKYHLTDADFEIRSPQERRHTMSNLGKVSLSEANDGQKLDKETRDKIKEALELIEGTEERANKKSFLELLDMPDEDIKKILNRPLTKEETDLIADDDLMEKYRDEQAKEKRKQARQKEIEAFDRSMEDYFLNHDYRLPMDAQREGLRRDIHSIMDESNATIDEYMNQEKTPTITTNESLSKDSPKKGFLGLFRKKK